MNRTRINQLLGVLLFPYLDPGLIKKDYFRKRYETYLDYMKISGNRAVDLGKKWEKNRKYQKTTEELIEYLHAKSRAGIKSYDDLLMFCESYYPFAEIESRCGKTDSILDTYFDTLIRIAESLLTYCDGVASIRTWNIDEKDIFYSRYVFDKVQIWNMLCCYMVPDVLIAAFAVECRLDIEALYGQKPYIFLADKLFAKTLKRGVAENHLHFNAGFDYETIWLNTMKLSNLFRVNREAEGIERDKGEQRWAAAVFRRLAAEFFEDEIKRSECKRRTFIQWVIDTKREQTLSILKTLYLGTRQITMEDSVEASEWLKTILAEQETEEQTDYLLATVYKAYLELKTSSEFILLFDSFAYRKICKEDECFFRIFLQYLRIKNEMFQEQQQSNLIPGLRHFQKYFDAAKKSVLSTAGNESLALDVFRVQARQTCLKKLEIRIAPHVDMDKLSGIDEYSERGYIREALCKQLYKIFYLYRRYLFEGILGVKKTNEQLLLEEQAQQKGRFSFYVSVKEICEKNQARIQEISMPTLGIVYHLLKTENLDHVSGYSCARAIHKVEGLSLGHRLFPREMMGRITQTIEELRTEIPVVNEYIVGLDAASDENAMEPWMFASAYNRMRSREKTKPVIKGGIEYNQQYSTIQNVGFTYHVGEDFRHIASGLRHVDEVIERFHYKPGDRLGHALVLGTDIDRWIQENEIVALPLGEHLDNLLWIWGKSVYDGIELSIQLERLEKEILETAKKIYDNRYGALTVMMLYDAYKAKFSSSHKEIIINLNQKREKEEKKEMWKGYCKFAWENCNMDAELLLWDKEKLVYTNYCPVFEERRNKVIRLSIADSEAVYYKELQEYLLHRIEQAGIYVETNPTSNVTIGDMDDLREHPIFRMNSLSPEGHHVMVTVNSDDPAVFNTNVENELAYIYYAMEHGGYAKEDILDWIDKIRQNGMDASFVQRVKDVRTLLFEVSIILDELKQYK